MSENTSKGPKRDVVREAADQIAREEILVPKMDDVVLVRVLEWTEWIPCKKEILATIPGDPTASPGSPASKSREQGMYVHNGFSAMSTGTNEKLVNLETVHTGVMKAIVPDDIEDPKDEDLMYYEAIAFKAVLALSMDERVAGSIINAQRAPVDKDEEREKQEQEEGRDKRADLVIVENGQTKAHSPNRAARRKRGK